MNETFPSSPLWDQMPYYPQTTCESFENINPYDDPYQTSFSPSFTTTAVIPASEQTIPSPEISSCTGNSGEKSAKPSTAAARRRLRASKKAPTTLLSTSIANFRAVVQQYTGCRRLASPASFKNRRGPIILRFGRPPIDRKLSVEEDSGRRCYSDQDRCQNQYPNVEFRQGQGGQQQQRGVSYDNSYHDSYISGVDNDHSCSMLSVDDYEW